MGDRNGRDVCPEVDCHAVVEAAIDALWPTLTIDCPPGMACTSLGVPRTRMTWVVGIFLWGWLVGAATYWLPVWLGWR